MFVTTPQALTDAIAACGKNALLERSLNGLGGLPDALSAKTSLTRAQASVLVAAIGMLSALTALNPAAAMLLTTAILALVFLGLVGLRLAAALMELKPERAAPNPSLSDAELPVYSVLVPLYREAGQVARLIGALRRLDYPPHRLDIKMIVEEDDTETVMALRRRDLPPQFEILAVPAAEPRTKPKALCYALAFARGELVTIYDAEDLPEPDQLRRAAEQLAAADDGVACLQARLAWYNWPETWFTRQMALEYASLFDVFLPALARSGLPLPLGGTSNHFRIVALKRVGAWDAYNVTEDADLGLRLARAGYRCGVLASTTWEEAPVTLMPWLRQRTRWLKGWMQTYIVHMRAPGDLLRRLGIKRFLAMQAVFGGVVLSAFIHPVFVGVIAAQVLRGDVFIDGGGFASLVVNVVGAFNLAIGYLAGFAIAIAALRRRPMWWLVPELALLPVYWLTISLAALRAVWQLIHTPSYWEKTEHGLTEMEAKLPDLTANQPGEDADDTVDRRPAANA
jgi:cellulose synthase/poly-beta-1,6-N-acetylglucosamine synthase-like glycosyltransferase